MRKHRLQRKTRICALYAVWAIVCTLIIVPTTGGKLTAQIPSLPAQQAIEVSGQVLDNSGDPVPGAVISVKDKEVYSVAGADGSFRIRVQPNDILVISYLGYEKLELPVGTQRAIKALLIEEAQRVEEVVVTGYQTISRERTTGSYGIVTSNEIENKLQPDLKSVLEGQVAGVVLDKDGNVEIRGISTFNAEKTPLIVVDGFPYEGNLNDINADNIENVTVLKDGVAASIYGSRAANGVIVVSTKGGTKGRATVSYKGVFNVTAKPNLKDLNKASSSDYIDAELDLYYLNPNSPSTSSLSNMSRVTYLMMQVREGNITETAAMTEIDQLRNVSLLDQAQKHLFRPQLSQQHNVSVSGGGDVHTYNVAVNLLDVKENFVHSRNDRLTFDFKNEWKFNKIFTAGTTVNVLSRNNSSPLTSYQSMFNFSSTSALQPYTALYDENGHSTNIWALSQYKQATYESLSGMKDWSYNFVDNLSKEKQKNSELQTRLGAYIRANIMEGLWAEFGGNWQKGYSHYKSIYEADSYTARIAYNDGTSRTNPAEHYFPDGAVIDEKRNYSENWTIRTQINFSRSFNGNKHRVNAIVGNEVRRMTYDNNKLATRAGYNSIAGSFTPVNIKDWNAGIYNSDLLFGQKTTFSTLEQGEYSYMDNRFVSWYGNGSYEYDSRFILSGSIRLDLTNFFGTDSKYRYKPLWSVGGTWKLANEKFFNVDDINRLDVRASYGINGNIALNQGPFLILSTGSYSSVTGGVSYGISSPPNNQLRWEKTQITNVGVDFAAFNHRLNVTVDYYTKKSTDLLASDAVDPTLGYTTLTKNIGAINNNGVEVSLGGDAIRRKDFRWTIVHNFTYNYNKVKSYNATRNYASSYATANGIMVAGYPADGLWGYKFAGLNEKGETMVYNADGDKILPGNATTDDVYYLGTTRPKFDLSLTNRFNYKNWEFSFMFIAKLGHSYRKDAFTGSNYQNRHVGERWREPGDELNTIYPVLQSWNMDMFYYPYIDKLVGNANYMKLRDITLSYEFDRSLVSKLRLQRAKIYVQARNLFRVTAKGVDIDPEVVELNRTGSTGAYTEQGYTSLPLPVQFYFGLQISF